MEKTKMEEVSITLLKVSSEDAWLKAWLEKYGSNIYRSPHYLYLFGDAEPMSEWMRFRKLPLTYITKPLMETFKSIVLYGQQEPILIYKDMTINTGHKRTAIQAFLGKEKIVARFVDDNYKL